MNDDEKTAAELYGEYVDAVMNLGVVAISFAHAAARDGADVDGLDDELRSVVDITGKASARYLEVKDRDEVDLVYGEN